MHLYFEIIIIFFTVVKKNKKICDFLCEFFFMLFILIILRYVVFINIQSIYSWNLKGFDDQKQIERLEHYCLYYKQFKFVDKGIIFLKVKDICAKFLLILNLLLF